MTQAADLFYFFKDIYSSNHDYLHTNYISVISPEAFNTLEAVVLRELQFRHNTSKSDPNSVKAKKLIKIIRNELEISKCFQSLIFGRFTSLKEELKRDCTNEEEKRNNDETRAFSWGSSIYDEQDDFCKPLHRIKVFNEIKKVLQRMKNLRGLISLPLLSGLINELRVKLNIEIIKFASNMNKKNSSSLGDFQFLDRSKIISETAQLIQNYTQLDIQLPRHVKKEHFKILRDFSLLHPTKLHEALDPLAFELEERDMFNEMVINRAKTQGKVMHKFGQSLHDKVQRDRSFVTARFIHNAQN